MTKMPSLFKATRAASPNRGRDREERRREGLLALFG